jgi:hypothetical protein
VESDLKQLVAGHTGGSPMGGPKCVRRSLRHLSEDLGKQKPKPHHACPNTVRRLLLKQHFALRANVKQLSGKPNRDRDRQFQHIQEQRAAFTAAGLPVLSLDSQKKELIGNFKKAGVEWCQEAELVNAYDFPSDAEYRASIHGIYDVNRNRGMVAVGRSADTGAFVVDCLHHWWREEGRVAYPHAPQILILADGGGSNGYRPRLFKWCLQQFANLWSIAVTVCHFATGASKWNPIEHLLFSCISINWAAQPLRSTGTLLSCIRGTTTTTGLRVRAWFCPRTYPTQIKITDTQMESVNLRPLAICPAWSYTISPVSTTRGP